MRQFIAIFTVLAFLVFSPQAVAQKGKAKGHHKEQVKKENRKNDPRGKIVDEYSEKGEYHRRNAMQAAEWHKRRGNEVAQKARLLKQERSWTQQEWLQAKEQLKREAKAEVQWYRRKAQEVNKYGKGESRALRERSKAEAQFYRQRAKEAAADYRELRKELNEIRRFENQRDRRRFLQFLEERERRHEHMADKAREREKRLRDWSLVNPAG